MGKLDGRMVVAFLKDKVFLPKIIPSALSANKKDNKTVKFVDEKLWGSTYSGGLRPCVEPTAKYKAAQESNRYMTVKCNGGLNQMRTGIADMVAVARIMNATLVIPKLDKRSFWQDSSSCNSTTSRLQMGSLVLPPKLKPSCRTIIKAQITTAFAVSRRKAMLGLLSGSIATQIITHDHALAQQSVRFREYIDIDLFDGYSLRYPQNWIQVKGSGADIFFRDPFVLDENMSVDISSPSSSNFKSVEDLGPPEEVGKNVMK